jgi:hypothetical protein
MNEHEIKAGLTERRSALRLVASQIKPLPEEVSPSEQFRRRTRRRLLALASPSWTRSRTRSAA